MKTVQFYLAERSLKNEATGCIEWKLSTGSHRYGQAYWPAFSTNRGGVILAHRLAYLAQHGAIPAGLLVLHKCDNRRCINFEHLRLGTNKDNSDDKIRKGRCGYGRAHGFSISMALQRTRLARLTANDVKDIRESCKSSRALASHYGVCRKTIMNAKRGKNYKWVNAGGFNA